ncbi:MAG: glutamate--tRNA ligase [Campylobacterota bacterium]|nr:glutamate--tRNA ligase [Campylobacterota bacterium]
MLRFAQSPTSDMDIGNLRVALFNYILSKQLDEELLIRIDDTNKEKNIENKDKEILETLALFSIDYSRVLIQSENIKYHTGMAMKLLLDKKAFNCFCSDEALAQDKEKAKKDGKAYSYSGFCETISDETKFHCNAPFVVRMKKPDHNIKFNDLFKGELDYTKEEVDSVIILNHDKTPTYDFACAVDDMLFDISTVIRDEEYLDNTPKQIHLREALGYDKKIKYAHLPTIINKQTAEKLSSDDKELTVNKLVEKGYLPAAIANYIVLLGFDTPKEVFTIEEAIEWFDIDKLSPDSVEFDMDKLNHINKEHLKLLDDLRFSKILGYADEDIGKLGKLYIEECNSINNIKDKIKTVFSQKKPLEGYEDEFISLKECLERAPFIEEFDELKKYISSKTELSDEKLIKTLSYALTGDANESNIERIYPLIRNYLGEII